MVLPKLGKSSHLLITIKIIPDKPAQRSISQVTPGFVLVTTITHLSTTSHPLSDTLLWTQCDQLPCASPATASLP